LTIVCESGIAGSPHAWAPVARLLEPEFPIVIHRRPERGGHSLPVIARYLHAALTRSQIPAPYLLVGHSFGALVVRQFAVLYPNATAGLVLVDGLPPSAVVSPAHLLQGQLAARTAEVLAALHLLGPLFPKLSRRFRAVDWAMSELRKLPEEHRAPVFAEWLTPAFYGALARTLASLPANLRIARAIPIQVPLLSLWSDYKDDQGTYVEGAGHWIQIDRPEVVAAAVRKLHAIIEEKGV